MSTMSEAAVRQVLRAAVEKAGNQAAFARAHGVGQQYISELMRGTRAPSPRILEALGLVRITAYVPAPAQTRYDYTSDQDLVVPLDLSEGRA